MPRLNSKFLTDPGIAKLRKADPGKRLEVFDSGQPGLSVRVTDKGSKSFAVYYYLGAKHVRLTIGQHPIVGIAEGRGSRTPEGSTASKRPHYRERPGGGSGGPSGWL